MPELAPNATISMTERNRHPQLLRSDIDYDRSTSLILYCG